MWVTAWTLFSKQKGLVVCIFTFGMFFLVNLNNGERKEERLTRRESGVELLPTCIRRLSSPVVISSAWLLHRYLSGPTLVGGFHGSTNHRRAACRVRRSDFSPS